MILNEYVKEKQREIKIFKRNESFTDDKTLPKIFNGIIVDENITLEYKSLKIADDPTSKEDMKISLKKGQVLAVFDQPLAISPEKMDMFTIYKEDNLLVEHLKKLFSKIKNGISAPTVNILEKFYGEEGQVQVKEQTHKNKNNPKI